MTPETSPKIISFTILDYLIYYLQHQAWTKPQLSKGDWGAPIPIQFIDKSSHRLLEVGSGFGRALDAIKKNSPDAFIVATDINFQALKQAKSKHGNSASYVVADATNLPFKSESFDTITMTAVATSIIGNWFRLLAFDCFRMLEPSGTLALSEFLRTEIDLSRQANDAEAFSRLDLFDQNTDILGVRIIGPFKIPKKWHELEIFKKINLLPNLLLLALSTKQFTRITQHRNLGEYSTILEYLGFEILNSDQTTIENPDGGQWLTGQVLAKKKDIKFWFLPIALPKHNEMMHLGPGLARFSILTKFLPRN